MTSTHIYRASSLVPLSGSQKRKKRRRASSVFSNTEPQSRQTSTRPADDELALVKAAAIKLLDHTASSNLTPILTTISEPILQSQSSSSPRPIKKIRFQDSASDLNHPTPDPQPSNKSTSESKSNNVIKHLSGNHHKSSMTPSLLRQCIDPLPRSQATDSLSEAFEDGRPSFQLKTNEIFNENAIVDAFQATLNEFHFYHPHRSDVPREAWSVVPTTEPEMRSSSALYYGVSPPAPAFRKKSSSNRPKLETLVALPRISSPPKSTTVITRAASPACSDLDLDEYIEMFGDICTATTPPPEPAHELTHHTTGSLASGLSITTLPTPSVLNHVRQDEDEEMSIGQGTSPSPSPAPFVESMLSTSSTTRTTPVPQSQTSYIQPPSQGTSESLTNALNAQYWAGYYTALYHRSVGIVLRHGPPVDGASSATLPCSVGQTGWEAGHQAGSNKSLNPS